MNKSVRSFKHSAQAGFTLIELVVVIVILGILAATAIPRFTDLSADARVAKMQAARAALQSGSALFHAQWLVAGSPANVAGAGTIAMEGIIIPSINGYPDVGGDGSTNAAVAAASSGIVLAAGALTDYVLTVPAATATMVTITPDAGHPNCKVTYTEAVSATAAPVIGPAPLQADCK